MLDYGGLLVDGSKDLVNCWNKEQTLPWCALAHSFEVTMVGRS